jgi:MoaA/NifB/PqqE/SkfB family radical SAM enzyme
MDGQLENTNWLNTASGEARGYIEPYGLRELWFHTGTACNLACPFCLEGSNPGDNRLERMTLKDVEPYLLEAIQLDVEQFSFTGGEPFIVKEFINILSKAASLRPCLVLTNGTEPLLKRMQQVEMLSVREYPVSFRISIDWPNEARHDAGRGTGTFKQSLRAISELQQRGFSVSLARQMETGEDGEAIDHHFRTLANAAGFEGDIRIVAFPDFALPGDNPLVPNITESCMTRYQDAETRKAFMCSFSKMLIKKNGRMRVYACTLVDDDDRYDQGANLRAALAQRVVLGHHRCYSCFNLGASCSERA